MRIRPFLTLAVKLHSMRGMFLNIRKCFLWGSGALAFLSIPSLGNIAKCGDELAAIKLTLSRADEAVPPAIIFSGRKRSPSEIPAGGSILALAKGDRLDTSTLKTGKYIYLIINPTMQSGGEILLWARETPEEMETLARSGKQVPQRNNLGHLSLLAKFFDKYKINAPLRKQMTVVYGGEVHVLHDGMVKEVNPLMGSFPIPRLNFDGHGSVKPVRTALTVLSEFGLNIEPGTQREPHNKQRQATRHDEKIEKIPLHYENLSNPQRRHAYDRLVEIHGRLAREFPGPVPGTIDRKFDAFFDAVAGREKALEGHRENDYYFFRQVFDWFEADGVDMTVAILHARALAGEDTLRSLDERANQLIRLYRETREGREQLAGLYNKLAEEFPDETPGTVDIETFRKYALALKHSDSLSLTGSEHSVTIGIGRLSNTLDTMNELGVEAASFDSQPYYRELVQKTIAAKRQTERLIAVNNRLATLFPSLNGEKVDRVSFFNKGLAQVHSANRSFYAYGKLLARVTARLDRQEPAQVTIELSKLADELPLECSRVPDEVIENFESVLDTLEAQRTNGNGNDHSS
ncbi:MAG: hypothetical protein HY537_18595 [Deltaproteobacteria bacterium]|nr:hypothetical protein [Deltaproteobacteria bacterium]